MKIEFRNACLSAAVLTTLYGSAAVHARNLQWDATGTSAPAGADGSGNWNLSSTNWVDPVTGLNTAFVNGDSATFGLSTVVAANVTPLQILLTSDVTVNNLSFATTNTGAAYNIFDPDPVDVPVPFTLTITGNVIKTGASGTPQIALTNPINLTAGNHIFGARDTSGDLAELSFNGPLTGAGAVTLDNTVNGTTTYEQYGTTVLRASNTYTGGTTIKAGRLVSNNSAGLGTGAVVISDSGSLAFGGAGTATLAQTIANDIKITRTDYGSTTAFSRYTNAIAANNDGSNNTITFNGGFDVASTDARVAAYTNTIVINSNITSSTGNGVLALDGDFAGFVTLNGNNAGLATGGVKISGGVELNVSNNGNLGGANSPITFNGGTLHPIGGFMTNFGTHVLNNATFNGGIDTEDGTTFTINQALGRALGDDTNRVGSLGKRGTGTLNINSPVNLRGGSSYYDGGIVNINNTVQLASLHLRSPVVNIGTGGSVQTIQGYSSFGEASTGTNGGPDIAVMNLTGTGKFIQSQNEDLNLSDLANTKGTVNISDSAEFTTSGLVHVGRNLNAVGTINQSGGTLNVNRTGDFAFILGRDNGKGFYNLSGGTFNSLGEVFVGQGHGINNEGAGTGSGTWTQTGGTATISNWFVVGRESSNGVVDISGGTLIKKGGGNVPIGEGTDTRTNLFTVRGTGTFDAQTGQVYVSNGNVPTIMTVQDSATFNVNDYFVVGRFGNSKGTLNVSGNAVINKGGLVDHVMIVGAGDGSLGTLNQTGGTINNLGTETWIGDGGVGVWTFSAGTINAGLFDVGHNGAGNGTLTVSGTAALNAGLIRVGEAATSVGTINLNGGTITANQLIGRNSSGQKTVNFNGGTLIAAADSATFMFGLNNANVQAGGAKINSNGHAITVVQLLGHDAALGATVDGGLTKTGAGTLTLGGSNTYTGPTVVNGGTLRVNTAASNPLLTNAGGTNIQNGQVVFDNAGGGPTAATIRGLLKASYLTGFASGQIKSSTATANRGLGYLDTGSNTVTVKSVFYGDADLDGTVTVSDFNALAINFGIQTGGIWGIGDFDYNDTVDISDFNLLAINFGQTIPAADKESEMAPLITFAIAHDNLETFAALTGVPEPTSLAAIAGAVVALGGRRRRRTV
jgi:autotransporter-associated beta strand protein